MWVLFAAVVAIVVSEKAQAQSYQYRSYEPYSYYEKVAKEKDNHGGLSVGIDLQGVFADIERDDFSSQFPGLNASVMYRFNNYWGIEVGGYQTRENKTSRTLGPPINTTIDSTATISGYYMDILGFIPIYDYVDGFLSIGYEQVTAEYTQTLSDDLEETGGGIRLGLGMEYHFKSGFSMRGYMRYHTTSPGDSFDGFFSLGLGGRYTF